MTRRPSDEYHPRFEESPAVLEDGRWVRRGNVLVWEEEE
jgi:hypothetical protein